MHCMTSDLWKTGAKNCVTNVNSLTQLYPILRINSIICYHSSRYNLETSVILSLGKCARPHLFHSSPIGRTFMRSFFFIGSFYIIWNCFWITAYKTSNNVLPISCCEFEYFSINKRYSYDSATKEVNRRTSGRESRVHSFKEISTSKTEYVPLRSVLRGSNCHFRSNLFGKLNVVQPPSSDSSFHLVPRFPIRLCLSYDLLFFSEN